LPKKKKGGGKKRIEIAEKRLLARALSEKDPGSGKGHAHHFGVVFGQGDFPTKRVFHRRGVGHEEVELSHIG